MKLTARHYTSLTTAHNAAYTFENVAIVRKSASYLLGYDVAVYGYVNGDTPFQVDYTSYLDDHLSSLSNMTY